MKMDFGETITIVWFFISVACFIGGIMIKDISYALQSFSLMLALGLLINTERELRNLKEKKNV